MSDHANNLHIGASVIGAGLIGAIMAHDAARKVARHEAEAEANSVASVRALRMEMAASLRREAALQNQLNAARFELLRAQAALRRTQGR
jgi:hypothetical protein